MSRIRAAGYLLKVLGVRQVRMRPGRAFLTMLSVVIGVAGVVAVTTATNATHDAYRNMFAAMTGRASLELVSERGGTCPQALVEQIEDLPGVNTAAPMIQRPTSLYFGELRIDAMVLGIDPARHARVHDYQRIDGRSLEREDDAVLDVNFARGAGIRVGDEVKIFTRSGMRRLKVTGLVQPQSVAAASRGGTVWVTLERAQSLFRLNERIDALQVMLEKDVEDIQVEHAVLALLPDGVIVRRPEIRSQMVQDRMLSAQLGLNVGCAYTLLAAGFIILNTFLMNVTERRRQLGILRALGATRNQVTQLLLWEGLLMGALGTFVGAIVGLAGAWALMRSMEQLFMTRMPAMYVSPVSLALGMLAGLGISMCATFFPARRAARVSPIEGMRRVPSGSVGDGGRAMIRVGLILLIAGNIGMAAALSKVVYPLLVIPTGFLVLIALILLIPAILPRLLQGVSAVLLPFTGVEGRIAQGQLRRWRVRTALTVGVVFVALSTGIGMGNSILDTTRDVREWFQQTLSAHFFVRGVSTDMVTGTASEMPLGTDRHISAIRGVQLVDAVRFTRSTANDEPILIVAREFTKYPELPLEVKEGRREQMAQQMREGQVVLGTVLSQRTDLHAGDTIRLETDRGPQQLRIAGVVTDYQVGGMMLYMERTAAQKLLQIEGVDLYLVRADDALVADVEQALVQLCRREGLLLQSFGDLARLIDRIMGGVLSGLWAILALEFLVAGFGIANTLTMNVLEQTREIGLLRVIGMTRRQVRKMIFAQAALIGLSALVLGMPGGVLVAWLINLCTQPLTGQPVELALNIPLVLAASIMALAIVVAAAWLPAERAVRLQPGESLAYE